MCWRSARKPLSRGTPPGGCSMSSAPRFATKRSRSSAMSQQINLYNPIFLKQKKHFSARTMLQALGLIALGVGALCGYAFFESRNAERTARQYTDQVGAQRGQLVQLVARLAAQGS